MASITDNMKFFKLLMHLITILIAGGALSAMLFGSRWNETVTFPESNEVIVNPMIGYAPIAEYTSVATKYSLVYVDVTWRELEPQKGVYDFQSIDKDNQLEKWRDEGKRVVFRFVLDKPRDNAHIDIPDWLFDEIDGDGDVYNNSYGKGFSPDYENKTIIKAHELAIKALGEYYGKDDFFAYVELGSLGHWGEWHVNYQSGIEELPDEAIRELYIKPYISAFPNAQILMRRSFTPVKTYGLGVFNDMTGDKNATDEWLDWINNGGEFTQTGEKNAIVPVPEVWNTAAVGGEFTSSVSMDWLLRYHVDETIDLVRNSHMSFIGPKMPEKDIYANGAEAVLNNIGYRFRIKKANISSNFNGKVLKIALDWTNDGVAPIYWDWETYLYLLDENNNIIEKSAINIDLTQLTSGKTMRTYTGLSLSNFSNRNCKLCIGIVDPQTGKPEIKFAMNANRLGNMSLLYEWFNTMKTNK